MTIARQSPLSLKFFMQEYWSGLPFFLQGIFPTQGSNPCILWPLQRQADSLPLCPLGSPLTEELGLTLRSLRTVIKKGSTLSRGWMGENENDKLGDMVLLFFISFMKFINILVSTQYSVKH